MAVVRPTAPSADPAAPRLTLVGWQHPPPRSALAGADGTARIDYGEVPFGFMWVVERLIVRTNSVAASTFDWYRGDPDDLTFQDGTASGNSAAAEYPMGVVLLGGEKLVGRWSGADVGARCVLDVQYRVLRV